MKNNNTPKRVIHFEIQADDVGRAKDFYEKVFDWKIEKAMMEDSGNMDYWLLNTGSKDAPGINGGMSKRDKNMPLYTYDCTIQVGDIDEAIDMVKKNGGKITREKMEIPKVGWFARGIDTEGNMFGLMEPTDWKPG